MTQTTAKTGKNLNVQVPGETAPEPLTGQATEPQAPILTDADVAGVGSAGSAGTAGADGNASSASGNGVDLDALREQIRNEERAKLQAELSSAMKAAETVMAAPSGARNYRDMRAHEVDPKTLTAPVLTKDGWVCPDAPPKK